MNPDRHESIGTLLRGHNSDEQCSVTKGGDGAS